MKLRFLPRIADVPEAEWDALVGPTDSPFVRHAWLRALEDTGCASEEAGWLPHHAALTDDDDRLVAAAPLYAKGNSEGEFVFDWSWADAANQLGEAYYPKLVCAVPFTPAGGGRVLVAGDDARKDEIRRVFAEALRELVDETNLTSCHLLFPRKHDLAAFEGAGFLQRNGVQFQFENAGYRDFEDFLTTLPTKRRTQLRRERGQAAKDGVTIRTYPASDLTPEVVDSMFDFYAATVDKFTWGRRYLNRAFFEQLVKTFGAHLAWVFAEKDGKRIAGAFNVRGADTLYGRYWGATEDMPFLHFNVCYYHGVDECIRGGLVRFEPGAGGEHKRVRGFKPTVTYSAHYVKSKRLRRLVEPFLIRERAGIARFVMEES